MKRNDSYSDWKKNKNGAYEEIVFPFINLKVDLKLLNHVVVEYLKSGSWQEIDTRYNEAMEIFEITAIKNRFVEKLLSGKEYLFIIIKCHNNDFTITFHIATNQTDGKIEQSGSYSGPQLPVLHTTSTAFSLARMNDVIFREKLKLLRTVEEMVYPLANTYDYCQDLNKPLIDENDFNHFSLDGMRCQVCSQLQQDHSDSMMKACQVGFERNRGKYRKAKSMFFYNFNSR